MSKLALFGLLCLAILIPHQQTPAQTPVTRQAAAAGSNLSDREQDGFSGPVRRVRVETTPITMKDGKPLEGSRVVRAITSYDFQGKRIDTVAHPVDSPAPSGKEQYKYDSKGNIIEMVLRGDNGSILSKETYQYEMDELGNWKKMTTSVAVYENGTLGFEPVEVTYRTITYYYNQAIDKLDQPATNKNAASSSPAAAKESLAAKPENRRRERPPVTVKTSVPAENKPSVPPDSKPEKSSAAETATIQPVKKEGGQPTAKRNGAASAPAAVKDSLAAKPENRPSEQPPVTVPTSVPENKPSAQPDSKPEKSTAAETATIQPVKNEITKKAVGPSVPANTSSAETKRSAEPAPLASSSAPSFYEQGVAHLKFGRNQEALASLKQAINLDPNDGRAYAKLGLAYAATGQHKEALAAFKLAAKLKPDAMDTEANYRMAEAYTATGKTKEALEAYKQALYTKRAESLEGSQAAQFPTMADIHFGLGLAYYNRESFSDAIKELKQAASLEPNSVDIQYGLGLAYLANGDRSSAQRQEKILRPLDPALADNIASALSSATPPGITRVQPREDRRMRP
jgi:YD repeat-containing protein